MNNNTAKEVTKLTLRSFTLPIIFSIISLILLFWFNTTDSLFEKLVSMGIFLTTVVPISVKLFSFTLSTGLNSKKYEVNKYGVITEVQSNNQFKERTVNYPTKVIDNENYKALKLTISTASRNRQFTRKDILDFKALINEKLEEHKDNYTQMTFSNDLHEIYTKIKSKKFSDDDYKFFQDYIVSVLETNANKTKA